MWGTTVVCHNTVTIDMVSLEIQRQCRRTDASFAGAAVLIVNVRTRPVL